MDSLGLGLRLWLVLVDAGAGPQAKFAGKCTCTKSARESAPEGARANKSARESARANKSAPESARANKSARESAPKSARINKRARESAQEGAQESAHFFLSTHIACHIFPVAPAALQHCERKSK